MAVECLHCIFKFVGGAGGVSFMGMIKSSRSEKIVAFMSLEGTCSAHLHTALKPNQTRLSSKSHLNKVDSTNLRLVFFLPNEHWLGGW